MNISDGRSITVSLLAAAVFATTFVAQAKPITAVDPGPRITTANDGDPDPGGPLNGLTQSQSDLFDAGLQEFSDDEGPPDGLGPTMNLDSCGGCHKHPALGGTSPSPNPQLASSPSPNPQVALANAFNSVPSFIARDGPVREVRFIRNPDGSPDGGVHSLFTIAGRDGAPVYCVPEQDDFETQFAIGNAIFRIPTPVFGAGLIEAISDSAILANQASQAAAKNTNGIAGQPNFVLTGHTMTGLPNNNGNDGTIARFGWKAQNKSLLLFSGEAYNVEMGISNELFPTERNETPECQIPPVPNDVTNTTDDSTLTFLDRISAIEKFAFYMRVLAPPERFVAPDKEMSINAGEAKFEEIGCALCHTPTLMTGNSPIDALKNKEVNLYSDLLIHHMGPGLVDGVTQGQAGPSEFRTAPLWGLGKRIFFLHDGRTTDLVEAIEAHGSGNSEAKKVVKNFSKLSTDQQQDVLNFLRSL